MNITLRPKKFTGKDFDILRNNSDRGLRIETYVTLGSFTTMFHKDINPIEFLDSEISKYKDYPVSLVQLYVYLTEYIDKPLDEKAFKQLEKYLIEIKKRNMRVLLRFAYEYEDNRKIGPKSKIIYAHTLSIKEWMKENESLIKDTVLVLQAGMVGVWGEWHTAKYNHNKRKSLLKICDMTPSYLTIQTRRQKFKDKIKIYPQWNRVGYHDDYLVGIYHKWSTPETKPHTRKFNEFVDESKYTLNDGEMPWGRDKSYNNGLVDGKDFIKGCFKRSLSTLSITHNCIEDGNKYNIYNWQREKFTPEDAQKLHVNFADEYFENAERTIYDFLIDHLGYQLVVEKITIKNSDVTVVISNNGFASPCNFDDLKIYTEYNGHIKEYDVSSYSPKVLYSGQMVAFTISDVDDFQKIGIKLSKSYCDLLSVRFANECEFKDNINWYSI